MREKDDVSVTMDAIKRDINHLLDTMRDLGQRQLICSVRGYTIKVTKEDEGTEDTQ